MQEFNDPIEGAKQVIASNWFKTLLGYEHIPEPPKDAIIDLPIKAAKVTRVETITPKLLTNSNDKPKQTNQTHNV